MTELSIWVYKDVNTTGYTNVLTYQRNEGIS